MKSMIKFEQLVSKVLVTACNAKLKTKANSSSSIYMYEAKQPNGLKKFKN